VLDLSSVLISNFTTSTTQILDIERTASDRTIKRKYRKLSLLYHPDKTRGNVEHAKKFEAVAKAKAALIDPEGIRNMMLFGHPDGRQSMFTGIGLPSWIEHQNSQAVILVFYALVLAVLIPMAIWRSSSTEKNQSRRESRRSAEEERARVMALGGWLADGARQTTSQS